jgi:hypothetical protein
MNRSDNSKRKPHKPRTEQSKRRRKIRGYYSDGYQIFVESFYEVSATLTAMDAERVLDLLAANLDKYTEPAHCERFQKWAVEWVQRLAGLTVNLKQMIPSLTESADSVPGTDSRECQRCAHSVLNSIDKYDGAPDDLEGLKVWASNRAQREALNSQAFMEWYQLHRNAVYRGLWDVLEGCSDLGLGMPDDNGINETVESLASDTWRWIADHVEEFLKPGVPLHFRLRALARKTARFWKVERLRERSKHNFLRRVGRMAIALAHNLDDPRSKRRPIVLGPGDSGAYEPEKSKVPLKPWDVPIDHHEKAA